MNLKHLREMRSAELCTLVREFGKDKDSILGAANLGFLFEALGHPYVGPIDGFRLADRIQAFDNIWDLKRPFQIHEAVDQTAVETTKEENRAVA